MTAETLLALAERKLWPRVHPEPNTGCWLWEGAANAKGYGQVWQDGDKIIFAHRLSYIVSKGPIAPKMVVCHRCDFPPCVNPDHLFLGTVSDNAKDMVRKRRHPICRDPARLRVLQSLGGKAVAGKNLPTWRPT